MDKNLFNKTMEGLIETAKKQVEIFGIADSLEDLLEIKKVIFHLQVFWNKDNQLTKFNWLLEFNKILEG